MQITWGLEEEVFIVEKNCQTSLDSLYYLFKLFKTNPSFYYYHSASNFARGKDIFQGLMSGVEISTDIQPSIKGLLDDLKERRKDLVKVVNNSIIVPLGHLLTGDTPSNTCGLHLHLGVDKKYREEIYNKLAYFLPLITLASSHAPGRNGLYFGKSYRIYDSYAIGPLCNNPYFRFQDLIISKRLGTVEIRVLDPFPDLIRLEKILKLVQAIVLDAKPREVALTSYHQLRRIVAREGFTRELEPLYLTLQKEIGFKEKDLFIDTPSDATWKYYEEKGLLDTYLYLDGWYRGNPGVVREKRKYSWKPIFLRSMVGLGGYYLPKLPFILYKAILEN